MRIDWKSLRGAIVVLALTLAVGAAATVGARWFHDAAVRDFERQKGRIESMRSGYRDDRRAETPHRDLVGPSSVRWRRPASWERSGGWRGSRPCGGAAARLKLPALRYRMERRTAYEPGLGLDVGHYRPFATVGPARSGSAARRRLRAARAGAFRPGRPDFIESSDAGFIVRDRSSQAARTQSTSSRSASLRWITLAPAGERT